ncbi:MAG: amidohydrolase family protein [Planctomycetota bacterium]
MDVAIARGVRSIEHGKAPWPVVLTDELQREHDDLLRRHAGTADQMAFTAKVCALGEASVSEAKLERLIDQILARDVFFCPTLEVFVGMADAPDASPVSPANQAVPKEIIQGLKRIAFFFTTKLVARGVKILVGQDGFRPDATFSEMRHLASCGLEPVDIIRGATRWPATLLGVADRLGAIAPGQTANILSSRRCRIAARAASNRCEPGACDSEAVVERDPLDDIGQHLRRDGSGGTRRLYLAALGSVGPRACERIRCQAGSL